jgi:hypothetical protein
MNGDRTMGVRVLFEEPLVKWEGRRGASRIAYEILENLSLTSFPLLAGPGGTAAR